MKATRITLFLFASLLFLFSCKKDDITTPPTTVPVQDVVNQYAVVVLQTYTDALNEAVKMQTAINVFINTPSDATLTLAKNAWLAARAPYGRSEAFRFYGGPIDAEPNGPEGLINSWPMDEAYLDYVEGDANAGIINQPGTFPTIDEAVLEAANQTNAEEEVSTGWHAIEFLL